MFSTVRRLLRFWSHVDGREKALKVVQHVLKVAILHPSLAPHQAALIRMQKFQSAIGHGRGIFRLTNWVSGLSRLAELDQLKDTLFEEFEIVRLLAITATAVVNDVVTLVKTGPLQFPGLLQRFTLLRVQFWTVTILMSVVSTLRDMRKARHKVNEELMRLKTSPESPTPALDAGGCVPDERLVPRRGVRLHRDPDTFGPVTVQRQHRKFAMSKLAYLRYKERELLLTLAKLLVDLWFCLDMLYRPSTTKMRTAVLGLISALLGSYTRWNAV